MEGRFVGRRRELAELVELRERLRAGRGSAVLVTGDAGMGKSALLAETLRAAAAEGFAVLLARASSDAAAPAFWPWQRLLASPAAAELGLHPGLLEPGDAAADPAEPPAAARFRTVVRCADALLAASARARSRADTTPSAGLVVALEDAHWADPASLQLLRHLWAEAADAALHVVATARSPVTDAVAELAQPPARQLALSRLGAADVAAYLGGGTDASWAAVLHRHSGGSPLFLRELARLLDPETLRAPAAGAPPAPRELRQVVVRRLGSLSDAARHLLGGAAAAGDDVELRLLPDEPQAVAEAIEAGVLLEDPGAPGRLRWSHPVVREIWYDELRRDERVLWHARLARALEVGGGRPGEIARHRLRAAVDDGARSAAAGACTAAAADAEARLAFDEAGEWHRAALPMLADPGERAANRLAQARAAFRQGQIDVALDHAEAVAAAAEELTRPELAAAAATVVTGIQGPSSVRVAGLCVRARALLGEEESPRVARVLAQHALALDDGFHREQAEPLSRRAWELAEPTGDPDATLAAARARVQLAGGFDGIRERLVLVARLREVTPTGRRPDIDLWTHLWRMDGAFALGAIKEVDAELFALAQLVDRVGWPLARWHLLRARASRALLEGRFAEAEALALEFRDVSRRTQDPVAQMLFYAFVNEVVAETGRFDDYRPDPAEIEVAIGARHPTFHAGWGWMRMLAGDVGSARRHYDILRPMLPEMPMDALWPPTLHYAARLAAALADREMAAWCYAALIPYGDYYVNSSAGAGTSVRTTLGLLAVALGRADEAVAHLADAVTMERRITALPALAHAQFWQARARALRGGPGDRERAAGLAEESRDLARRLGMRPAAQAAADLAAELSGATAGPAALTAREREIASLVAGGRSNREIADALVISERTVETHVRNVLAKLGLTNRTQVATWAARAGL